ncbi:hypothetical protein SVIOM74S_04751 [Streptomyces violarus]
MPRRCPMPREKPLDAAVGDVGQAGEAEDLFDSCAGDAVRVGEGAQVVVGGAAGVDRAGLQQGTDLREGRGVGGVGASAHGGVAAGGGVEAEDHPHGRGLAGAVRAEEAGDGAGADGEGQVRDDRPVAVAFGEFVCRQHASMVVRAGAAVVGPAAVIGVRGVVPGYYRCRHELCDPVRPC